MNPTMYSRELKNSCQLVTNIAVCYPLNTRQLLNFGFNCNVYLYINWKKKIEIISLVFTNNIFSMAIMWMKSLLFLSILRFDVLGNSKYKLNIPYSEELKILILINLLQTTGEQG